MDGITRGLGGRAAYLYGSGVELIESVFSTDDTALSSHTSSRSRYTAVRRSAPLGSISILIPRVSGSTPPVDWATSTCALGEGSAAFVNQAITSHLPTWHVSTSGLEKRVLERAEPRYLRTLGKSSRRMPARLP